jgi:hypothetical protein
MRPKRNRIARNGGRNTPHGGASVARHAVHIVIFGSAEIVTIGT